MFGFIRGLTLAALVVLPALAYADPIGPNCTSCDGGIYTLTWAGAPISTTATTETDQVTLTINTSGVSSFLTTAGFTNGPFALNAVAIKIASSVIAATLVSAPGTYNLVPGGISAGGCNGAGSGFDCAQAVGLGAPLGGILTFVFNETIALGTAFTSPFAASIKALYVDATGRKAGSIVSEGITLQSSTSSGVSSTGTSSTGISSTGNTPEPGSSSLAVLGLGLLAASFWKRRKA